MVAADGVNKYSCRLYTHNPRMSSDQKNSERGRRLRAEFLSALEEFDITEDRVVYVKSKKHYRGESAEIYEHFLGSYDIPKETLIMHDGGHSFKRGKVSIFDSLGFPDHVTYPTDVHQWLSPNDNNLHGCKSAWKEEYYKFRNDVHAPLRLMQLIDLDTKKNAKYYFKRNLLNVTKTSIKEIMKS